MTPRNIVLRSAAALVAMIGIDLALAHLTLADGLFLGRPFAPFDPPLFSPSQFEALERIERELSDAGARPGKFDPELGWCNKPLSGFGEFRYDWAGARMGAAPLGREKTPGVRRDIRLRCQARHFRGHDSVSDRFPAGGLIAAAMAGPMVELETTFMT
jgi:hypothetical protein